VRALEEGQVVQFARTPVALPSPEDLAFLREELPARVRGKNVSYYLAERRLVGVEGEGPVPARALDILAAHSERVRAHLTRCLGSFARNWRVGPLELSTVPGEGPKAPRPRQQRAGARRRGAYGATHGDRILRFFINVHPTEDRQGWRMPRK
jgi:hypothetical protein